MKKSILNLEGAKLLSKSEQKSILKEVNILDASEKRTVSGGLDCYHAWDKCSGNWDYFDYCMRLSGCAGTIGEQ